MDVPPPNNAFVDVEQPPQSVFIADKSPKSVALPVDAIVIYSITFVDSPPGCVFKFPPPLNPLVELQAPALLAARIVESPKSVALPVDAIVT